MTLLKAYLRGEYENPFVLSKAYLDILKDEAAANEKFITEWGHDYKEWTKLAIYADHTSKFLTERISQTEKDIQELAGVLFEAAGIQYVRWTKEELDNLDEDDRENYEVGDIKIDERGAKITESELKPLEEPIEILGEDVQTIEDWEKIRDEFASDIKRLRLQLKNIKREQKLKAEILSQATPKVIADMPIRTEEQRKELKIKKIELGVLFLQDKLKQLKAQSKITSTGAEALKPLIAVLEAKKELTQQERKELNSHKSQIRGDIKFRRDRNLQIDKLKTRITSSQRLLQRLGAKIEIEKPEKILDELEDIREEERRQETTEIQEGMAEGESRAESSAINTYGDWQQWFIELSRIPKGQIRQNTLKDDLKEFFDNIPEGMLQEFKNIKPIKTEKDEYGLGRWSKSGNFTRAGKNVLVPNLESLKRVWEIVQNKPKPDDENEDNWAEKQAISTKIITQVDSLLSERQSIEPDDKEIIVDEEGKLDIEGINLILERIKEKHEEMPGDAYKVMNIESAQQLLNEIQQEIFQVSIRNEQNAAKYEEHKKEAKEAGRSPPNKSLYSLKVDDIKQLYLSVATFRDKFSEKDFPYYHELTHTLMQTIKKLEKEVKASAKLLDDDDYEKIRIDTYNQLTKPLPARQTAQNKREYIESRINTFQSIVDEVQEKWSRDNLTQYIDLRFPDFHRKTEGEIKPSERLNGIRTNIINRLIAGNDIEFNHYRALLPRNVVIKTEAPPKLTNVDSHPDDAGEWEEDETEEEREARAEETFEGAFEAGYGGGDIFAEHAQQRQQEAREEEIKEKFEEEDVPDNETEEQKKKRYAKFKEEELEETSEEEQDIQRYKIKEKEKKVAPKPIPGKSTMDYEMRRRMGMEEEE